MNNSDQAPEAEARITPRLIHSFYTEAMLLADEARSYFDESGHKDRDRLDPFTRVAFACESLKVTTRVMHIVAWLLTQRAIESGEIHYAEGRRPERRLGNAEASNGKPSPACRPRRSGWSTPAPTFTPGSAGSTRAISAASRRKARPGR